MCKDCFIEEVYIFPVEGLQGQQVTQGFINGIPNATGQGNWPTFLVVSGTTCRRCSVARYISDFIFQKTKEGKGCRTTKEVSIPPS
jgi:hypothetical protein